MEAHCFFLSATISVTPPSSSVHPPVRGRFRAPHSVGRGGFLGSAAKQAREDEQLYWKNMDHEESAILWGEGVFVRKRAVEK